MDEIEKNNQRNIIKLEQHKETFEKCENLFEDSSAPVSDLRGKEKFFTGLEKQKELDYEVKDKLNKLSFLKN